MTRKCSVLPSLSLTSTSSPVCMSRNRQKIAGYPPGRSRCPSITALPRWPGLGPTSYQPTPSHGFCVGVARSPLERILTCSIGALTPIAGIARCIGDATTLAVDVEMKVRVLASTVALVSKGAPCATGWSMDDNSPHPLEASTSSRTLIHLYMKKMLVRALTETTSGSFCKFSYCHGAMIRTCRGDGTHRLYISPIVVHMPGEPILRLRRASLAPAFLVSTEALVANSERERWDHCLSGANRVRH